MNSKPVYFYNISLASRKAEATAGQSYPYKIFADEIAKVIDIRAKWVAPSSAPMFRCRLITTAEWFVQHIP
jgi:hypothetical protein